MNCGNKQDSPISEKDKAPSLIQVYQFKRSKISGKEN